MQPPEQHRVTERIEETQPAPPARPAVAPHPAYSRAIQIVWFVTGLIDALLAIRFTMKILGASPQSDFTVFVYGVTQALVAPFRGIFPVSGQNGYVLEPASAVAIVIYALIGWAVVSLIRIMTTPRGDRTLA